MYMADLNNADCFAGPAWVGLDVKQFNSRKALTAMYLALRLNLHGFVRGEKEGSSGGTVQNVLHRCNLRTDRLEVCSSRAAPPAEAHNIQGGREHLPQHAWEAAICREVGKEIGALPVSHACQKT